MSALGQQSLHEARELYVLLQAIEDKFRDVERQAKQTRPEIMEVLNLTYQMIDTISAFGAGDRLEVIIKNLRRLIYMINLTRAAILALQATTPVGLLMGAAGVLTGAAAYVAAEGNMRT